MLFRTLSAPSLRRVTVDRFPGLDRREGAAAGSCAEMENLWSGAYPALAVCPAVGAVTKVDASGAPAAGGTATVKAAHVKASTADTNYPGGAWTQGEASRILYAFLLSRWSKRNCVPPLQPIGRKGDSKV